MGRTASIDTLTGAERRFHSTRAAIFHLRFSAKSPATSGSPSTNFSAAAETGPTLALQRTRTRR